MSYALFAVLFCSRLKPADRVIGWALCAALALAGAVRTFYCLRVRRGRDPEGTALAASTIVQSLVFCLFSAFATWHVRGDAISEGLLVVGVAGLSSVSAGLFAPFSTLARTNVALLVLPSYCWSFYAIPRYGWLIVALILVHAVALVQLIRIASTNTRKMLTVRLQLEEQGRELRHARDAAVEAGAARMRFLAHMSHEIRTPLNGVIGLTDVLRATRLDPDQRSLVEDVARSGDHLLSIVNDVLDLAKVTAGKLEMNPAEFDLARMIHDVATPAAALARAKGLALHVNHSAHLPQFVVGDAVRCRQVLANLLGNAVKFTNNGEVRLSVASPGADWVRFEVADTGIGMSPEELSRLFREFQQADSSSTRRFGGTGLGLVISLRFAELMHGRLWADSRPGIGSRFFFEVPLPVSRSLASSTAGAEAPAAVPTGLRILLAEDNPTNRKVLCRMLEAVGAQLDLAENGRLAWELQRDRDYDLILMDCQMPEMDGYEATERIRMLPGSRGRAPIIGVTADAFQENRERCARAGMNAHLSKPFTRAELFAAIDCVLQQSQDQGQGYNRSNAHTLR
jgi:signal transduction histidine kinase